MENEDYCFVYYTADSFNGLQKPRILCSTPPSSSRCILVETVVEDQGPKTFNLKMDERGRAVT